MKQALRLPTGLGFAVSVVAAVAAAIAWPGLFSRWGAFETKELIVPLVQLIMFGMGTTLSPADFARVLRMPWPVFVGMLLQFTVMPFVGWGLAALAGLPPLVAAGVVLVGACPGGVASNVITYLAGGNVPLSVTMTACSTLLSPFMTPLMMTLLADQYVPVGFQAMMADILKMIVLPLAAGLLVHRLLRDWQGMGRVLPAVSMGGICLIVAIITSLSRDRLLEVAPALILVVVAHNTIGYLAGYFGARALRLDERDARTVAIEVGLQNGGMASGLAIAVLKSSDAALAPALFGPWMNVSGSFLASCWRRRPAARAGEPTADAPPGSSGDHIGKPVAATSTAKDGRQ